MEESHWTQNKSRTKSDLKKKKINIFKKWNLKKSRSFRWKEFFFFFWGSPKGSLDTVPCFHFESRKIFIQMEKEKKVVLINILEWFYTICDITLYVISCIRQNFPITSFIFNYWKVTLCYLDILLNSPNSFKLYEHFFLSTHG